MAPLKIHGFIQIWSKKTGVTKSREVSIKTVEGKKETSLVVIFNSGEFIRVFQLSNNITSVVLRHDGERQSCLNLTLKNNSSLFIDKLSYRDAEQLKMFLDKVHQNKFQSPMKYDNDWGVFDSRNTQKEIDKTPFHKVCDKPNYGSFNIEKGSETPFPQKVSSLMLKSPMLVTTGLSGNQGGKWKRTLSYGLEMNEGLQEENNPMLNKKMKADSFKYVSSNEKKPLNLKDLRRNRNSKYEPPRWTISPENPSLDKPVLSVQPLSSKRSLEFPSEQIYSQNDPGWNEPQESLGSHPEQLWQGFPNLGNTCYMNAILQSLFAIPSFADDLLMQGVPWKKIPFRALVMLFSQLLVLKDVCNIRTKKELLVNIKSAISVVSETFSGNMQNDAHEFLGHCLDRLKEDMEKLNSTLRTERELGDENSSPHMYAGNAAAKVFVCPVVANFEFELQRSIICKGCGWVVLKAEPSNYLSINLPQETKPLPFSIQNSFDLFFRAEELEYNCERCRHTSSVAMHKFSRLPRVLIVHLKRYSFNGVWLLVKDNHRVHIPKYLSLSSHCNDSTKPPLLLGRNAPTGDSKVLKISQEMTSEVISPSTPSVKLIPESSDSLALQIGSDKDAEPQNDQKICEESSQEQQQTDLENGSKLNVIESELVNSGDRTVSEKKLPAADSMDQEDTSLPMICEGGGKPTSSPHTGLVESHLQEVPDNPELKKYEKTKAFIELGFDSVTETTEDFHEDKENRIPERPQGMAEQLQQHDGKRIYEEFLQQEPTPSIGKPNAQEHTEKDLNIHQKANLNSLGALGSDKNPGSKEILDTENTEAEARELKRNAKMGDPLHAYRLVSVVSHLGHSPNSGHYISDVYDFQRQAWFTYSDLRVSQIKESVMQKARLCTGYIFFYMHNEIFEALLGKAKNSQVLRTEVGMLPYSGGTRGR
ncbi:PREDICTED: ubiquitin carboxyl-terminal hydrolase 29 [Ceratotherium simum simum]|uniref:Ubiquitin carboxyl-terminal hydrolase n=1 Tax=Ceratotherium simum simum TaxID=73337 RepID=A0ABM0I341_CERSS|nr:PREDICTED: ubiquitin carboxyl-terminal hydrolase 29 [Ceratotherium simum simum]